jgi:hypothetical protein
LEHSKTGMKMRYAHVADFQAEAAAELAGTRVPNYWVFAEKPMRNLTLFSVLSIGKIVNLKPLRPSY